MTAEDQNPVLPGWLYGKRWRNVALAVFIAACAGYCVWLLVTNPVLWFTDRDFLNIYYSWSRPFSDIIRGNIFFFGYYSRPMGALLLYLLYSVFGFNPIPFHVAGMVLGVVNLAILYLFVSRLARSREAGAIAVLLAGFRALQFSAYADSEMLFDSLAFFFYFSAFALYASYRGEGRVPGGRESFRIVLLYIAAINSRETSVTFPVALLLYELVVKRTGNFSPETLFRRCRVSLVTGLLTLLYIGGKVGGLNVAGSRPAWHLIISLPVYLNTLALILVVCIGLALFLRNPVLIWASLFNVIAILPLAFLPVRDNFAGLMPIAGGGIYAAVLLGELRQRLTGGSKIPRSLWQSGIGTVLLVLVVVSGERALRIARSPVREEQNNNRLWWNSLRATLPPVLNQKSVLALHDPFRNNNTLTALVELGYNEHGMAIDTSRTLLRARVPVVLDNYDYVVDYAQQKFALVRSGSPTKKADSHGCPQYQPLRMGVHDETDPRIQLSGLWTRAKTFPATYEATISYSNDRGAHACFNIEGTGLRYVYTKAFNRGIAEITVDGEKATVVDLYSPVTQWQAVTSIGGFSAGRHQVFISVTGDKNVRAADSYIDVDAVEVF